MPDNVLIYPLPLRLDEVTPYDDRVVIYTDEDVTRALALKRLAQVEHIERYPRQPLYLAARDRFWTDNELEGRFF